MEHAATTAGGSINATKAKAMWDEWFNDHDHLRDELGPEGQVELYVRTDVQILEDDLYIKGETVKRCDKEIKNGTEEQITKLRRRTMVNVDEVGEACSVLSLVVKH